MSANSAPLRNTICEPSGEAEADHPSSLSWLAFPPRIDTAHTPFLAGDVVHDAKTFELSGNHAKEVTSEIFGTRGWISPVESRRKYAPVLSEYARYLLSGDIAEVITQSSAGFV